MAGTQGRSRRSPCCVLGCGDPVLFDGESAVRAAVEANRAMGTLLVRVTMARWDGGQHPDDGRAGLAGARLLHPEPAPEIHHRPDIGPPRGRPAEPVGPFSEHCCAMPCRAADSSGIKFLGDGEWLARKHGTHRRRQYRKVHLAMDTGTDDIRAVEFTFSDKGDSPVLPELLSHVPPIAQAQQTPRKFHQYPWRMPALSP